MGSLAALVASITLLPGQLAAQSAVPTDNPTVAITIDSEHLIELYRTFPGLLTEVGI